MDDLNAVVTLGEVFGEAGRIIGAAIVNEKNFGIGVGDLALDLSQCGRQSAGFVEHRDDDASLGPHAIQSK